MHLYHQTIGSPSKPGPHDKMISQHETSISLKSIVTREYRSPVLAIAAASGFLCLYILSTCSTIWFDFAPTPAEVDTGSMEIALVKHAVAAATPLLEVFQIYPPVLTLDDHGHLELTDGSSNDTLSIADVRQESCQETLAVHSFGYSYGSPLVGAYTPPTCQFNRVTWNLTVTSAGRQFDRLGIVYLGDVEVFRTTTAEPTTTGIRWVYLKV